MKPKVTVTCGKQVFKTEPCKDADGAKGEPKWKAPEWCLDVEPHLATFALRVFDEGMLQPVAIGHGLTFLSDYTGYTKTTGVRSLAWPQQQLPHEPDPFLLL